ncbi:MAG: YfhO family protein, partial [Oscillospiraceae bacterium]
MKNSLRNSLKWQWLSQKKTYLLIFAIPFCIMYLVYAVFGVHPYGDGSVLVLDLNGQYVYYYEYMRDAFWGDSSMIYSWSRNLSGEMFGIIGYYLASPFSIIPILLPRAMMCGSIELMELCKIGAAAVAFSVYLRHRKNNKIFTVLIFSTIYALMGYCVVQLMNPMWIDGLVYLPLIVRGIEFLIDDGRKLAVIIPLSLMFIANFYIGYMVGIFSALYFVFYCFAKEDRPRLWELAAAALRFTLCAVVSVMCAMIILLPVYQSLKLGKFDFTNPQYEIETKFTVIQFLTKMMPFAYDTVRPEGLPVVYSSLFTVILIPLFFLNKNIKIKQKVTYGVFSVLMFVCMYISVIDIAWHGFQLPNWLNHRYSFMFCFLLIVMAAQ